MKEEKNKKEKKYLEIIFKFYNERKLLIAVVAVIAYGAFSVIAGRWTRNTADWCSEVGYHMCVAAQNVSITV